MDFA
jgi:hypothetical protein